MHCAGSPRTRWPLPGFEHLTVLCQPAEKSDEQTTQYIHGECAVGESGGRSKPLRPTADDETERGTDEAARTNEHNLRKISALHVVRALTRASL